MTSMSNVSPGSVGSPGSPGASAPSITSSVTERRVVVRTDVELAVTVRGERGRPAVVLVHGYPDTSAVWADIAAELARDHFVVTYDVRGAGASGAPASDADYSLAKLSTDLAAVIDATCDGPVHLVGHDWGSIASWESVTDPAGFGGRLRSFTSISGPCLDHVGYWMRAQELGVLARQGLKSWYIGAFQLPGAKRLWRVVGPRWAAMLDRIEGARATAGDRVVDGARGIALYRTNVPPRLASPRERRTELPVQLIVPVEDRFVDPRMLDGIERWVPQVFRRDVRAGHWSLLDRTALVADWLREWIARVDGPRTRRTMRAGSLGGKLAIVTGAGSGIGRATALELVARGADVVAVDLDRAAATVTAELCELVAPGAARVQQLDVTDRAAYAAFADEIARTDRCPDIVVNNAGIAVAGGLLATTDAEWDRVLAVNLDGVATGCRLFARQMLAERRPGHIVNVASAAAYSPSRLMNAYATSKAAVAMFTECLRAELAASGIRVGGVYPGFVDTPITTATRYAGTDDDGQRARQRTVTRLYRMRGLSADRVARHLCDAIEADAPMTRVGVEAVAMHWLARFAPAVQRRIARIEIGGDR